MYIYIHAMCMAKYGIEYHENVYTFFMFIIIMSKYIFI